MLKYFDGLLENYPSRMPTLANQKQKNSTCGRVKMVLSIKIEGISGEKSFHPKSLLFYFPKYCFNVEFVNKWWGMGLSTQTSSVQEC